MFNPGQDAVINHLITVGGKPQPSGTRVSVLGSYYGDDSAYLCELESGATIVLPAVNLSSAAPDLSALLIHLQKAADLFRDMSADMRCDRCSGSIAAYSHVIDSIRIGVKALASCDEN